ncbi:ParM/StbA family protein [Clostridium cellulovorans]|uniref:StbA family protein n=1 Tax=Clostridium cellulovorans (strain ATCC 35296 / DSM 3052 / OCM 3 / 743B) TaxID=573061 RepID=D9SVY6_CLOC7|nr:ParM/StbA family protein [Clostridium cellulovorans]ADL53197.1 StbA family protein [Clostridium cellulovorans 743B]
MILGIDIGNYSVKTSTGVNFKSLVSTEENLLGSKIKIEFDNKTFYIGEGNRDTELDKASKESFLPLLYSAIALSSPAQYNKVVVGLPINQYKSRKAEIENKISKESNKKIILNDKERTLTITEFKVYPEGVGAYQSLDSEEDMIIIDIGGRTTDIAYIFNGELKTTSTVNVGTLNIYKNIADQLNSKFSIDIDVEKAEKIIKQGYLSIDNKTVDISFVSSVLRENFMKIKADLDFKFSAHTEKLMLTGGGAALFHKAFVNRYEDISIMQNPVLANVRGFKKVGELLWV